MRKGLTLVATLLGVADAHTAADAARAAWTRGRVKGLRIELGDLAYEGGGVTVDLGITGHGDPPADFTADTTRSLLAAWFRYGLRTLRAGQPVPFLAGLVEREGGDV